MTLLLSTHGLTASLDRSIRLQGPSSYRDPFNLYQYFDGSLLSSNVNGKASSVNYLDGGGTTAIRQNMPANDQTSNQYFLMTHFYSYFGALLGCDGIGQGSFPAYSGSGAMGKVHKYMNIGPGEFAVFRNEFGYSMLSFGFNQTEVTPFLSEFDNFSVRCATPFSFPSGSASVSQTICNAPSCSSSSKDGSLCSIPDSNGTAGIAPQSANLVSSNDSSGSGGTNVGAIAGGVVGGLLGLALLALGAFWLIRRRQHAKRQKFRWEDYHDGQKGGRASDSTQMEKTRVSPQNPRHSILHSPNGTATAGAVPAAFYSSTSPSTGRAPRSILQPAVSGNGQQQHSRPTSPESSHRSDYYEPMNFQHSNSASGFSAHSGNGSSGTAGGPLRVPYYPAGGASLASDARSINSTSTRNGAMTERSMGTTATAVDARSLTDTVASSAHGGATEQVGTPGSAPPMYERFMSADGAPRMGGISESEEHSAHLQSPVLSDPHSSHPPELHGIARDIDLPPEEADRLVREAEQARSNAIAQHAASAAAAANNDAPEAAAEHLESTQAAPGSSAAAMTAPLSDRKGA